MNTYEACIPPETLRLRPGESHDKVSRRNPPEILLTTTLKPKPRRQVTTQKRSLIEPYRAAVRLGLGFIL